MKIELTKKEKCDLLREVLAGTIETDNFKRLFGTQVEQPLFNIITDERIRKLSNETISKIVEELNGMGIDLSIDNSLQ